VELILFIFRTDLDFRFNDIDDFFYMELYVYHYMNIDVCQYSTHAGLAPYKRACVCV